MTGVPVDRDLADEETVAAVEAASAASAAPGLQVMTQQAKDQRAEIAQSLVRLTKVRPNICLLNHDQILHYTCDIATAPEWMQNTYNTEQDFTWAFAGYNVLLSSFYPGGTKSAKAVDDVTGSR